MTHGEIVKALTDMEFMVVTGICTDSNWRKREGYTPIGKIEQVVSVYSLQDANDATVLKTATEVGLVREFDRLLDFGRLHKRRLALKSYGTCSHAWSYINNTYNQVSMYYGLDTRDNEKVRARLVSSPVFLINYGTRLDDRTSPRTIFRYPSFSEMKRDYLPTESPSQLIYDASDEKSVEVFDAYLDLIKNPVLPPI